MKFEKFRKNCSGKKLRLLLLLIAAVIRNIGNKVKRKKYNKINFLLLVTKYLSE